MKRFAGLALCLCLGLVTAAPVASGQERSCNVTAECSSTTVCTQEFIAIGPFVFGPSDRRCRVKICNDDTDCARFATRTVCLRGLCTGTVRGTFRDPPPPPPPLPPGGRVGEGSACGRIKIGQVTKNVGCPRPFVCDKGTRERGVCVRPQA